MILCSQMFLRNKSIQQIISFSPGKDNDILPLKSNTKVTSAQNISKISNNLNNTSKKIKSKTGIKMNKMKSGDKILINKDKINKQSSKSKKTKEKSPGNHEILKYQTLEVAKANEIISKNSPNMESNIIQSEQQKNKEGVEFNSKLLAQNSDFLSFIEKHEKLQEMSKNRRIKNKDSSIASTNTGATTNINFPNLVSNKFVRPFSGDENKQTKGKVFEVDKKKLLVRPKTAQIQNESKSNNENRFGVITPTNLEIDRPDEYSNHMPLIEEKSSHKSTTDYKLSSNHSGSKERRENKFWESPKVGILNEGRKKNEDSLSSSK